MYDSCLSRTHPPSRVKSKSDQASTPVLLRNNRTSVGKIRKDVSRHCQSAPLDTPVKGKKVWVGVETLIVRRTKQKTPKNRKIK